MYRVDLYARVRRACRVEGMSTREVSRVLGLDRKTVGKMLSFSVPPGYRRGKPPRRPKLGPFTGIIDRILEDDRTSHHKQRHTAKRIFDRLRDEYGFTGGYTNEWTEVFGSERLTGALLDRLTHHVNILEMNGESYRLNQSRRGQTPTASEPTGIVTLTPWLRHGRCFSVSECARYLTVVTAFRRSSSSMPSGCIAVSR